jgi:hypothetical protein
MVGLPSSSFWILIFLFSLLSFTLDISTNECFKNYRRTTAGLYVFLFFHHFLAAFLYIGWISNSKFILIFYCLFVIVIVLHWITNEQKCILTQIINYYCKFPDEEVFHDIFYFIGMKKQTWFNTFIYAYIFVSFLISLFKISEL